MISWTQRTSLKYLSEMLLNKNVLCSGDQHHIMGNSHIIGFSRCVLTHTTGLLIFTVLLSIKPAILVSYAFGVGYRSLIVNCFLMITFFFCSLYYFI